jgi:hypothetical protein
MPEIRIQSGSKLALVSSYGFMGSDGLSRFPVSQWPFLNVATSLA